jgi:hypothetical protein
MFNIEDFIEVMNCLQISLICIAQKLFVIVTLLHPYCYSGSVSESEGSFTSSNLHCDNALFHDGSVE